MNFPRRGIFTVPSSVRSPRYQRLLERLVRARTEAGLTQTEVARTLRRPQSWVSKVESGERRLDVVELEVLAVLYQKRMRFFLEAP